MHKFLNFILEWNSACFGLFTCPSSGVFHCTHSNGIRHTGLLTACKLSANLYDVYHCCVYSEKLLMTDRGTVLNMQSFIPKKFEKFVHLVGFIIRNLSRCTVTWTSNSAYVLVHKIASSLALFSQSYISQHFDSRLCSSKGWHYPLLLLALPKGTRAKDRVVLKTYTSTRPQVSPPCSSV